MTRHAVLISAGNIENSLPASLSAFHDFLTSPAGGSWREEDITVTGPLSWPVVQLLQARLREYAFVLVYRCGFPAAEGGADGDFSALLRSFAAEGRGIYIEDSQETVRNRENAGRAGFAAGARAGAL